MIVSPRTSVGGTYQRPNQFVGINATDISQFLQLEPGVHIAPSQLKALQAVRSGVIAGVTIAQRYGWKVGDRISLHSSTLREDGSADWTFDIVGTFTQAQHADAAVGILGNYSYVNESRLLDRNTVGRYAIQIGDRKDASKIAREIDSLFFNSPHATVTQSETETLRAQIKQIADVAFLAHAITASAFIGLLLATAALLMQSNRERVPEFGVLKTLGYSDGSVMALIISEAVTVCVTGAVFGLALSTIILPRSRFLGGVGQVPAAVLAWGIAFALLLALLGASIPAWRGLRLQITDALATN
jgi:putative ABC transport system permease protein